jgi:hypothetical protein
MTNNEAALIAAIVIASPICMVAAVAILCWVWLRRGKK